MKTKTKNHLCTPALAKAEMEHPHSECRTEQEAGEKRDRERAAARLLLSGEGREQGGRTQRPRRY